jgi:cysteinyl-tRNA synthetase
MVKHLIRTAPQDSDPFLKWLDDELKLNESFQLCKTEVHKAFCDNVDTRSTLEAIRELVSTGNSYIESRKEVKRGPCVSLLKDIALYITKIFNILGIETDEIGFKIGTDSGSQNVRKKLF